MKEYMDNQQAYTTKRKMSGFVKGYLIFLGASLFIVVAVLAFLWFKLDGYQKEVDATNAPDSQESSSIESDIAAQQCFKQYIDSLSTDDWVSIYRQSHPDTLDSDEKIAAFITSAILPAKSSVYRCSDYQSTSPRFMIGTKSSALATFIMSGSGNDWTVSEAKITATGSESFSVTAAQNCEIRINGASLGSAETGLFEVTQNAADLQDYSAELSNPVIFCTYTANGLLDANPSIEVSDSYLSDDGIYYEAIEDTDGLINQAESFVKAILNCYAQGKNNIDDNLAKALVYVDSSSPAAKVIRETKSGLEWTPPDNSISMDTTCSPLCRLADNCCFVEVFCASGNLYRVNFLNRDNGYKIVLFSVK